MIERTNKRRRVKCLQSPTLVDMLQREFRHARLNINWKGKHYWLNYSLAYTQLSGNILSYTGQWNRAQICTVH